MPSMLDDVLERINAAQGIASPEIKQTLDVVKDWAWAPNPGPQTEAYLCEADELLFGGEPGGGKTDLVIGLSLTAHSRSLVMRRTNKEADKLVDRYAEVLGTRKGYNSQDGVWRFRRRIIDIGGCQLEGDKQKRKGIPHDLKAFDQLEDFTESMYLFIITWNRAANKEQRSRIVSTCNPPTTPEGMWIVRRWAAWLDPNHPKPAKSGEIRWYARNKDGSREFEVDDVGPHMIDGELVYAKSRCFIRSELADNPDLAETDYQRTLDSLSEDLRAMRKGDFTARIEDQLFQCIPSEWVRMAQERWSKTLPAGVPMCAIGVDASGGGKDPMVLAPRYDGYYPELTKIPGSEIPKDRLGAHCAGIIISHRRDKAIIIVDMSGGYGGAIYEKLKENDIEVLPHKGAEASVRRTKDHLYKFVNKRTEVFWKFREALDPDQPGGSPIALPHDTRLFAQLVTPTFEATPNGIKLQTKEDVMERLGHSPDEADAVVMSWAAGPTYVTHGTMWMEEYGFGGKRRRPSVQMSKGPRR
jgi:hypothetical protein